MHVLFFGSLADRLGRAAEVEIESEGSSIAQIRRRLAARDASFADALMQPGIRASVDHMIVPESALVRPGQEVAFFPLLSGG